MVKKGGGGGLSFLTKKKNSFFYFSPYLQVHTYYPVSSGRGRAGERVEARLPTYSQQWEANERLELLLNILIGHHQINTYANSHQWEANERYCL